MTATYLSILRRRKWVMLAVVLLFAPVAFWTMHLGAAEYRSDASVLLVTDRVVDSVLGQGGGFEEPERRMATELAVFSGRVVASRAAESLAADGWAIDADGVQELVEIAPVGFSRAIEVVGSDEDAERARRLTDAVVTAYLTTKRERSEQELAAIEVDLAERIEDSAAQLQQFDIQLEAGAAVQAARDAAFSRFERQSQWLEEVRVLQAATDSSVEVLSAASTPTEPSDRLPAPLAGVVALLGAAFLAAAVALLLELIKDSVRTTAEAEQLVHAPVLVEMARPSRRSATPMAILGDPTHPTMAAARALRLQLEGLGGGRLPSRVLVAEATGDVAESFMVGAALATACGRAGARTLLVADPVPNLELPATVLSERDMPTAAPVVTRPGAPEAHLTGLRNLWSVRATSQPGEDRDGLLDHYSPDAALDALAADFDVVVLVPPLDVGIFELIMLRRIVDVATLVCGLHRTPGQRLRKAIHTMERHDAAVDGLIVVTRSTVRASSEVRGDEATDPSATRYFARSGSEQLR